MHVLGQPLRNTAPCRSHEQRRFDAPVVSCHILLFISSRPFWLSLASALCWPGLITYIFLAPANEADGEIAPILEYSFFMPIIFLFPKGSYHPALQSPPSHRSSPLQQ